MQDQSVAVKGCSYQLFDEDRTALVPQNVPQYRIAR